jgi:hypothetical protein
LKNNILPAILKDKYRKQYIEAINAYRKSNNIVKMLDFLKCEQEEYYKECEYFYSNSLE